MLGVKGFLLLSVLCMSGGNQLNTQRYQRIHTKGGSYLVQVSANLVRKERAVPSVEMTSPVKQKVSNETSYQGFVSPRVFDPSGHAATVQPPIPMKSIFSPPVVDIFFIFADIEKFVFAQKQLHWVLPTVASMLIKTKKSASEVDSEVRIHILSDSTDIITRAGTLGFYSYDLVPHIDKHVRFLNKVARTVNSTASELGFFRWKVLNHIVTDWNSHGAESPIRRVIALNGEVLVTVNAAELYERVIVFCQKTAPTGASSRIAPEAVYIADAMMLYSPKGLNAFDAYIDEWFNNAKRDELRRKSVGTHNRLWSDIILFEHFANTSTPTSLRVKWFDSALPEDTAITHKLEQRYIEALGCEPLPYYDNPYGVHVRVNGQRYQLRNQPQRSQVPQDPRIHDIHIAGPEKQYPYCFMGFVHKHTKNLMYAYGRTLEILRGGEEAHSPTAFDSLAGDMLLAPDKSREVYYIHSNSSRYFIASKEEFTQRLFLTREQVIGRVPVGLIEAFRPLPFAYPWKDKEFLSFNSNSRTYYYVENGLLRPLASVRVLEQFNLTVNDVKIYNDFNGPIFNSLPIGPQIDIKDKNQ